MKLSLCENMTEFKLDLQGCKLCPLLSILSLFSTFSKQALSLRRTGLISLGNHHFQAKTWEWAMNKQENAEKSRASDREKCLRTY